MGELIRNSFRIRRRRREEEKRNWWHLVDKLNACSTLWSALDTFISAQVIDLISSLYRFYQKNHYFDIYHLAETHVGLSEKKTAFKVFYEKFNV